MVSQYLQYHSAKLGFLLAPISHFHAVLLSRSLFNTSKQNHNDSLLYSWNILFILFPMVSSHSSTYYNYLWLYLIAPLYHLADCEVKAWVFIISVSHSTLIWHLEPNVELKWNGRKSGFLEEYKKDKTSFTPIPPTFSSPTHKSKFLFHP